MTSTNLSLLAVTISRLIVGNRDAVLLGLHGVPVAERARYFQKLIATNQPLPGEIVLLKWRRTRFNKNTHTIQHTQVLRLQKHEHAKNESVMLHLGLLAEHVTLSDISISGNHDNIVVVLDRVDDRVEYNYCNANLFCGVALDQVVCGHTKV